MRKLLAFFVMTIPVLWAQSPIVIRATTVLDGKGKTLKNTDVVVEGSRVIEVRASRGAVTYDLRGLTVMPGWIDTHVHIGAHFEPNGRASMGGSGIGPTLSAAGNAYATLMGGFTTVQSLGAQADKELRDSITAGAIPGPRILTSLQSINENTGDPEKIRAFVREQADQGADVIKLFATKSIRDGGAQSMTDAQIQAACGEARAQGRRSVVHAHAASGAKAAILAGCTSIEHGAFLDDEVLGLMRERGVYFDPNFLVLHNYLDNKPKFLGTGNYTEEGFAYMVKALPLMSDVLRRAIRQKVKVILGTDAVAGAHGRNAEEFIYRVRDGGQSPMDAIVSATSLAAESLGLAGKTGSIAPGQEADLIATDGNPLEDITAVRRVVFVMKSGQVYKNIFHSVPSTQYSALPPVEWPYYGGDQGGMKYSTLEEINRNNVQSLQAAWEWKTGEKPLPQFATTPGTFQNTPLMIDNVLYVSTPYNRVVALDAETGREIWSYDPKAYEDGQVPNGTGFVHRGVAAWRDGGRLRIFLNSRYKLISLDAETGKPVASFGDNGVKDLSEGLVWPINKKHYTNTSPPVVYKDLVILGNGVADRLVYKKDPPGDVRAFDARTGRQVWRFHTVPQKGEAGSETWENGSNEYTGHANIWAPMALDERRGLLYLPGSTPSNDFYGGRRLGSNLFAEALICLDASTGKRRWHFQTIHHGLWDYDLPSPPSLASLTVKGRKVDAVVQLTKTGFVFVFDRVTGKPVWPIEERPAPPSTVPGERSWPTQPVPTHPPPIIEQGVTLDDAFDLTPELKTAAQTEMKKYVLAGLFTPPGFQGMLMRPGIVGGANWGGGAFDPESNVLYVRTSNSASLIRIARPDNSQASPQAPDVDAEYARVGATNAVFFVPGSKQPIPLLKPPYAHLTAMDMNKGEVL